MTLTNQQRSRIYRKAAEKMYESGEYKYTFCCIAVNEILYNEYDIGIAQWEVSKYFPELFLFFQEHKFNGGGWWRMNDNEERPLALLFASEIAKDKIKI